MSNFFGKYNNEEEQPSTHTRRKQADHIYCGLQTKPACFKDDNFVLNKNNQMKHARSYALYSLYKKGRPPCS